MVDYLSTPLQRKAEDDQESHEKHSLVNPISPQGTLYLLQSQGGSAHVTEHEIKMQWG